MGVVGHESTVSSVMMTLPKEIIAVFADVVASLQLVARLSWRRNVTAWFYVPIGLLIILLATFGVSSLIGLGSVSFPASVACMVVLFFGLIALDLAIGDRKTKQIVNIIEIPAGFALRYINIFFTPSFVLLPLSPAIGGIEVGKIIAVFVIGYVVVFTVTAYMVRGLQLMLGSSKRAIIERAEEMGAEDDGIPLSDIPGTETPITSSAPISASSSVYPVTHEPAADLAADITTPAPTQDPAAIRNSGEPPTPDTTEPPSPVPVLQTPAPLTRPQRWATFINANLDRLTYLVFFLFIGLPIYYATGYAMPVQLTFNILAYFAALSIPAKWRQYLHPVLVSSGITILGLYILGLIRGDSLHTTLKAYKTGTEYTELWHGEKQLAKPGAGDIFSSVLDASIVALALPMFQYRHELYSHFVAIVLPNLVLSVASLFGYPAVCYAIGISATRSLAFSARSLTLALATPAVANIGGDSNTVAALAIMSGIMGVLIGQRCLTWLRIPDDDYITRGVTLGANSSAIATALLLVSDPRAAALSSLSMSLFGIMTVALTSVPPIANAIMGMVGL